MKSQNEILEILLKEISSINFYEQSRNNDLEYCNAYLGDTSFILAGLLESSMLKNGTDWINKKWIDDCLISYVEVRKNIFKCSGIVIWGERESVNFQWTDPFNFEMEINFESNSCNAFEFLFCDLQINSFSYDNFKINRDHWSNTSRNWRFSFGN